MGVGVRSNGGPRRDRLPRVEPRQFGLLANASLVAVGVIVLTGAAVRLTGSGLGCPDWPSCFHRRFTPPLAFHPLVEFSNRLVTVVLVVVLAATLLAALRRRPFRADLAWLSAGLLGGVLVQAVIGAAAVYTKLNPYVVLLHFLASMVLVAVAVVLVHRCRRDYRKEAATRLVPRTVVLGSRLVLVLLGLVLVAGTVTTGTGPHAGNASGQLVARRIPVALRDMAELHSSLALLLIGVTVGLAIALHAMPIPEHLRRAARILCAALGAQAVVGYAQYFSHLPVALVEIHVLGATVLTAAAVRFHLSLTHHPQDTAGVTTLSASSSARRAASKVGATG